MRVVTITLTDTEDGGFHREIAVEPPLGPEEIDSEEIGMAAPIGIVLWDQLDKLMARYGGKATEVTVTTQTEAGQEIEERVDLEAKTRTVRLKPKGG